jgi:hypothetical protein
MGRVALKLNKMKSGRPERNYLKNSPIANIPILFTCWLTSRYLPWAVAQNGVP